MKHMTKTFALRTSFYLFVTLVFATLGFAQNKVNSVDPYANETKAERDARMEWFREARFGMFIHWGVYAVPAGTYNGKQIPGIGEWIMNKGKIPMAEYQAYASQFNPVKYDPDAWVRLARDAGMKYIVITSKHHDGFALFDSKVSKWDVVDATPYGKDLIAPLAKACKKYGLKLGLYYSQAQDWNQGGSAAGGKWDPAQEHDMDDYIRDIAVPQVKEILSNYGPISVLWWDTPRDMNNQRAEQLLPLLTMQPGIIHNNRLGGDYKGDISTPEQHIPGTGLEGDWESCMTMNRTWGFKSYDHDWKSSETLIRNLVDIASKGGNYLLNVGPTAEGLIPGPSIERLKAMGAWMKVNSESIYGTKASPCSRPAFGRITQKEMGGNATLYLHVFDWPADGNLFVPVKNKIKSCYLLADKNRSLKVVNDEEGVTVLLTGTAVDPVNSVVVLNLVGATEISSANQINQQKDGSILLSAKQATINNTFGTYVAVEPESNAIGSWDHPKVTLEWTFRVNTPGTFNIIAEIASTKNSALKVSVGNQSMKATIPAGSDINNFTPIEVGSITIDTKGEYTLYLAPDQKEWNPVKLRHVALYPSENNQ
jgi:alpha-L-fucosidase